MLKLGAAKKDAGLAYGLVSIQLPDPDQPVNASTFTFALNRKKLKQVRLREGRYLLRSNLNGEDPAKLWEYYIQLTEIEQANSNTTWPSVRSTISAMIVSMHTFSWPSSLT